MPAPSSIVELRSAAKRFGEGPLVLDQLNLAAQPGDFISLIGPSGCGKSTLLRLIAGLSPATSGEVRLGRGRSGAAPETAFVFQDATLLPWLTAGENVEIPLRLRRLPAEERKRIRESVLQLVRLGEKAQAYPRQLSGGQQMRISLARALAVAPEILLLDEPFGALDEMTRQHLNEELLAIRETKPFTAFFVTHSVAEAVFLSNRVVILASKPGRIQREVTIPFAYPRTDETRQLPEYHRLVVEISRELRAVEPADAA